MQKTVHLSCGSRMPILGLGTFQIKQDQEIEIALDCALSQGYRLIDTAAVYRNEKKIGACLPQLLKKYALKREDIFLTTKLSPKDLDKENVKDAVLRSLKNLNLDYIDLFLIHWPGKQSLKREDTRNAEHRKDTWTVLEDIHTGTNTLRAIGVSNYTVKHMKELLSNCRIKPAVLQSEFHPDCQQKEVIELCSQNDIHFQAYSSLGCGNLIADERFLPYALKYTKTLPQILLRWAVQKSCGVIPKSTNPKRIVENCDIFDFEINSDDIASIDAAGKSVKYAWDPTYVA